MCLAAILPGAPLAEVPVFANDAFKVWQNEELKTVFGGSFEGQSITVMRKDGSFFLTFARCRLPQFRDLLRSMNLVRQFKVVRLQSLTFHLVDVAPVDPNGEPLSPTAFLSQNDALPVVTEAQVVSHLMKPIVILVVARLLGKPQFKLTLLADGQITLYPGEIAIMPKLHYDGNPEPTIDFEVFTL